MILRFPTMQFCTSIFSVLRLSNATSISMNKAHLDLWNNAPILTNWCIIRGYSHILMTYGDVPQKWVVFFCKKSLDNGSHFSLKNPEQRVCFTKFSWVCIVHPENFEKLVCFCDKIPRIGYLILEQSLKMGTYFRKNYPLIWVWVLSLHRYTPTKPNLSISPCIIL